MEQVVNFLRDLEKNNNREWFQANRKRYESAYETFLLQVDRIINMLAESDPLLLGVTAKETVFRIYRDVRFSKDKTPYKTHFGAYIARNGRKSKDAAYYLHLGTDEFFIAGGAYAPEKEELNAIRREILFQPEKYRKTVEDMVRLGFRVFEEDKLKTAPKGFDKDDPNIDLIRNRHYILTKSLDHSEVKEPGFAVVISSLFNQLRPYIDYINAALSYKGNE